MTKEKYNEIIQWGGAIFIILGHVFNAMGGALYPWNIVVFTIGTLFFLLWAYRTQNAAQSVVNVVSIVICIVGLIKAFN